MSNQPHTPTNLDDLVNLRNYLARGGTLAALVNISQPALEATYSMAYQQYQNCKYEEAAKAFQYLCFYDQWNPRYFLCLGACQQAMKLFSQAIETYNYTVNLDHTDPLPVVNTGDSYLALKEYQKASMAYKRALDVAENNQIEHEELARIKEILAVLEANHGEVY